MDNDRMGIDEFVQSCSSIIENFYNEYKAGPSYVFLALKPDAWKNLEKKFKLGSIKAISSDPNGKYSLAIVPIWQLLSIPGIGEKMARKAIDLMIADAQTDDMTGVMYYGFCHEMKMIVHKRTPGISLEEEIKKSKAAPKPTKEEEEDAPRVIMLSVESLYSKHTVFWKVNEVGDLRDLWTIKKVDKMSELNSDLPSVIGNKSMFNPEASGGAMTGLLCKQDRAVQNN